MGIMQETVVEALGRIPYPGFTRDLVSLGVVKKVRIEGDRVRVDLDLAKSPPADAEAVRQAVRLGLEALPGVARLELDEPTAAGSPSLKVLGATPRPSVAAAGALDERLIPEVRHAIAVASGKGGVGKSTVAVNLAAALAARGARTGLLDADIYGPSIPLMTGLVGARPRLDPQTRSIVPFERFGVRLMSLGFLVDPEQAVIWRGPMVMKALEDLLRGVSWGALDVLVIDMPPGTGDAQLTLSQRLSLSGAVIVTTPQDVALADAIKGVTMFRRVGVPLLGLVENMSYFHCPHCDERSEIFGHGGGQSAAARLGVPFLGEIPLDTAIRTSGDAGNPVVAAAPDTAVARAFGDIAGRVLSDLDGGGAPDAAPDDDGLFGRFRKILGS